MRTRVSLFAVLLLLAGVAGSRAADTITNNKLYYEPDTRVPMTSLSLVFHGGGSQQETEELAGLADVTTGLLFRGPLRYGTTPEPGGTGPSSVFVIGST